MELKLPTTLIGGKGNPLKHKLHLFLLEEMLSKQQGKNILNNLKRKTPPPETNDFATTRPEHSNTEKAEENDLQIHL